MWKHVLRDLDQVLVTVRGDHGEATVIISLSFLFFSFLFFFVFNSHYYYDYDYDYDYYYYDHASCCGEKLVSFPAPQGGETGCPST